MKTLTRKQRQSRKAKAVRFTRDVLGDPDRANEIENESLEEYAQDRHIKLLNPKLKGRTIMPTQTRRELLDRIAQLEEQNDELQGKLDDIADLVSPEDDDQGEE